MNSLLLKAMTILLLLAALTASLAGLALLLPGSPLDYMWELNPRTYRNLAPLGRSSGMAFLLIGAALGAAGYGWSQRSRWGWQLSVGIIAMLVLEDLISLYTGYLLEGALGVTVAGALLFFLLRPRIRSAFGPRDQDVSRRSWS